MAILSPSPKLQFFDANGNPLVGGKLYTYAAGTTTPLASYTDSSGGTANTNPIILDSRGEANVWLASGTAYKFVLQSAASATIWTVDNIDATLGTMASQNANNVAITGGSINGTTIGATTASSGAFTTLSATGNVTLGDASTDTLNVGNGGLVKDASGNVGIGTASPALPLHVASTGAYQARFERTSSTNSYVVFKGTSTTGNNGVGTSGDNLSFITGGTERAIIDASGNLGLGVTPSAWDSLFKSVDVGTTASFVGTASGGGANVFNNAYWNGSNYIYKTTSYATRYLQSGGAHNWYYAASGTAGNTISFTQAMTLDASGNLGVGATSLSDKLTVGDGTVSTDAVVRINGGSNTGKGSGIRLMKAGSAYGYIGAQSWLLGTGTSNNLSFSTTGASDVTIDTSGNLLVGTTSNTYSARAYFAGNSTYGGLAASAPGSGAGYPVWFTDTDATSTSQQIVHFTRNATTVGFITTTNTATTYSSASDYRLKNTVEPMTGALARVAQLKPVTYKWNSDGSDGEGFIAHELQEVCPVAVHGTKDAVDADGNPDYQGIDTSFLVATLTAAIQELKATVDAQAARITALEA